MPFPYELRRVDFAFERKLRWGDVYWYDFGRLGSNQIQTITEPHLGVVVSNPAITRPGTVLLVPITGNEHKKQGYAFQVLVTKRECPKLDKDSLVKADQIYCVSVKPDLPDQYYLTHFDIRIMTRIYDKLLRVLNLEEILKNSPG